MPPDESSPVRYLRSRDPADAGRVLAVSQSMDALEDALMEEILLAVGSDDYRTWPVAFRNPRGDFMVLLKFDERGGFAERGVVGEPIESTFCEYISQTSASEHGVPDPLVIAAACEVQRELRPVATILYGSRARGDHHAGSDIDLIYLEPSFEWVLAVSERESATAILKSRLGCDTAVQSIGLEWKRFCDIRKYRNSFVANALLEGFVFGLGLEDQFVGYPARDNSVAEYPAKYKYETGYTPRMGVSWRDFRSPYDQRHGPIPPPAYTWELYNAQLREGRQSLRDLHTWRTGTRLDGRASKLNRDYEDRILNCWRPTKTQKEIDSSVCEEAGKAIAHALTALHLVYGGHLKTGEAEVSQLLVMLGDNLNGELQPSIPWAQYGDVESLVRLLPERVADAAPRDFEMLRAEAGRVKWRIDARRREFDRLAEDVGWSAACRATEAGGSHA